MSAPVKRTVSMVVATMLMAAFSTFLAITLARLVRQHHAGSDGESAATGPDPADS
jgi:hypothetical protein